MTRQTSATINLHALKQNLKLLQSTAPGSKTVAVVKADAYGNGATAVAKALSPHVSMFAVAIHSEAISLRDTGITLPILILQGPHEASEVEDTISYNLHWMMHNDSQFEWLAASEISAQEYASHLWVKFDSGMHRLGFPIASVNDVLAKHKAFISPETVVSTHLACADEANKAHANKQISSFLSAVEHANLRLSIANSAGVMAHNDARQAFNRLGIAMFGASPFDNPEHGSALQCVMSLHTQIIALRHIPKGDTVGYGATWKAERDSVIATVGIGYADGYPRHAPIGTPAICQNKRIELIGRVSMDMLTFDVTDLAEVALLDEVELWGEQLSINEVAKYVGTIPYELMTRISQRVPRVYVDET